jgi:hypothetical protein
MRFTDLDLANTMTHENIHTDALVDMEILHSSILFHELPSSWKVEIRRKYICCWVGASMPKRLARTGRPVAALYCLHINAPEVHAQ